MKTFSRACAITYLTVQSVGLCGGAPCIALYRYHGDTISHAPGAILELLIFGAILTLIPTLFYAVALAAVIRHAVRRNWPGWTPYLISLGLMTFLFFALVSLTSRPIPDLAMYFMQEAPAVRRPALSASEVPILVATLVAGLLGARVCTRFLRLSFTQKDA
jgi:hypothetical protein